MQCIQIERRYGPFGITWVTVTTKDGRERIFTVGRHVGNCRIYELAEMSAINL